MKIYKSHVSPDRCILDILHFIKIGGKNNPVVVMKSDHTNGGVVERAILIINDDEFSWIEIKLIKKTNGHFDLLIKPVSNSGYLFPLDYEVNKGKKLPYLCAKYVKIAYHSLTTFSPLYN
jgi:hypothetical protein